MVGGARDVWRRLRFLIDQARAWSEATGGNLRQYLRWVDLQTTEGARVAESVLPGPQLLFALPRHSWLPMVMNQGPANR